MKYIITFSGRNGTKCTAEAFAFGNCSAEQSMTLCINHYLSQGYRLVSITTAPLDGSEEPCDDALDTQTPEEFVLDDFMEQAWSDTPVPQGLDDIAPHWEEFLQDCRISGRPIPADLTPALYVEIWNNLCAERKEA